MRASLSDQLGICGLPLNDLEVLGTRLAAPWVGHHVEGQALSLMEGPHAGLLDGTDVDEDVRISAFWRDEAISLLRVEELHCAGRHEHPLFSLRAILGRSLRCYHDKVISA